VRVVDCPEHFPENVGCVCFSQSLLLEQDIVQFPALEDLSDDVVAVGHLVELKNLQNVGVVQSLQHGYLLEAGEVLGTALLYCFQGALETQRAVKHAVDRPKRPLSDFGSDTVVLVEAAHPAQHQIFAADAQLTAKPRRLFLPPIHSLHFLALRLHLDGAASLGGAFVLAAGPRFRHNGINNNVKSSLGYTPPLVDQPRNVLPLRAVPDCYRHCAFASPRQMSLNFLAGERLGSCPHCHLFQALAADKIREFHPEGVASERKACSAHSYFTARTSLSGRVFSK